MSGVKITRAHYGIALSLIALAVTARLLPHPANFAPVTAIALFGGAILPRRFAPWVPLAVMVVSDVIIGFYSIMPIVWACYLVIALASSLWLRGHGVIRGAGLTVAASTFFFVVTNFAVWLFDGIYPHTVSGLAQCYTMALPFFRNTFLSDLVYTAVLFGAYMVAGQLAARLTTRQERI